MGLCPHTLHGRGGLAESLPRKRGFLLELRLCSLLLHSSAALVSKPENIGAAGDPRTSTATFAILQILISVSALLIIICFCFDIYSIFSIGVFSGKDRVGIPLHQN